MTKTDHVLLDLVREGICGGINKDPQLSPEEWALVLKNANRHKLLPVVFDFTCVFPSLLAAKRVFDAASSKDTPVKGTPVGRPQPAVHTLPFEATLQTEPKQEADARQARSPVAIKADHSHAESTADDFSYTNLRIKAIDQVARQAIQENEFLNLILALQARGLEPVVMKGCVCRSLWPKPLLRPSVDDDLLIPDDQVAAYHAALLELGMTADESDADREKGWELSYHKPNSPLYIELHKRLFDPESDTFLNFNAPFEGALDRAVPVQIQDVTLKTLAPTDHLLFLILHAFKHFLFSGFGLRIVADVCLYARQYTEEIDFGKISGICAELRCDRFTAALFRIGEKYLGVSKPMAFALPDVDESALLEDVLAAGLVGADIDRLHSANITLGAVADHNTGKAPSGGLRKALLPSAKQLSGRYPWLEKRPWLLPAAWAARIGTYLKTRGKYGEQSPAASLRIGKERVELLRSYGIIDKQS